MLRVEMQIHSVSQHSSDWKHRNSWADEAETGMGLGTIQKYYNIILGGLLKECHEQRRRHERKGDICDPDSRN